MRWWQRAPVPSFDKLKTTLQMLIKVLFLREAKMAGAVLPI